MARKPKVAIRISEQERERASDLCDEILMDISGTYEELNDDIKSYHSLKSLVDDIVLLTSTIWLDSIKAGEDEGFAAMKLLKYAENCRSALTKLADNANRLGRLVETIRGVDPNGDN